MYGPNKWQAIFAIPAGLSHPARGETIHLFIGLPE
jgi:hypothetical protein